MDLAPKNGKKQNQKELKRLISKLGKESRGLEDSIAEQEEKIQDIDQIFSSKDYFKNTDSLEIARLQSSKNLLQKTLDQNIEQWETVINQLEDARSQYAN